MVNPLQRLFEQTFGRVLNGFARGGLVVDPRLKPGEVAALLPRPVPSYAAAGGPPDDWDLLEVLLDGEVTTEVIAVDVNRGVAIRYKLDAQGNPVTNGNSFTRELHRGNYSLRWRDPDGGLAR